MYKVFSTLFVFALSCTAVVIAPEQSCSADELDRLSPSDRQTPSQIKRNPGQTQVYKGQTDGQTDSHIDSHTDSHIEGNTGYSIKEELTSIPDSLLRFAGLSIEQQNNHQRVTQVDPHGLAARAGIASGDEIEQTELQLDTLVLRMNRGGRFFSASIKLSSPQSGSRTIPGNVAQNSLAEPQNFNSGTPQSDQNRRFVASTNASTNTLRVQTDSFGRPIVDINQGRPLSIVDINAPIRLLANYQLELIVDQSLSMGKRDCPGGLSRWDWCGLQAADLSRAISSFVPEGLTITPFNSGYRVYRSSNPQDIVTLFQRGQRAFGTRLAEPLEDRFNSFFKNLKRNPKPLLIAVITDGIPFPKPEPEMVVSELVKASRRMSYPTEVTVVFFQIGGNDRFGHNYLQYLDQNLYRDGARFHLVHTFPFEQLQQIGLANALVQTVQTYGQAR